MNAGLDSLQGQLQQVRQMLSTTPPRWLYLAEVLPGELLTRKPAPGEWSAVECLRHLIDAERGVFPVRVQAFLSGQPIAPFDPDAQGAPPPDATPTQLAEEFQQLRAASLGLLGRLNPADLERATIHAQHGHVTLGEMLNEWATHDLNHTMQGERALMQPFIVRSGPWRPDFAEHEFSSKS